MNRPPNSGSDRDPRGRDGDRKRRGPPPSGRGAVEAQILDAAKALDKPIIANDFAVQEPLLHALREKIAKVRPSNLASFEFDPRTRLFTVLLRVGRQALAADAPPEKVQAKNKTFAELGALWKTLGEEERAAQAFAGAGDAKAAISLFEKSGGWEEAAQLHARGGRASAAAKLYEQHEQPAKAAAVLENAGDHAGALRFLIKAGEVDGAREILKKIATDAGKKLLLQLGAGDLLLDFLAARGRWEDIGRLYEKSGMHADAAQAFLKSGRTHMAIHAFRKAGDEDSAQKVIGEEVAAAQAKGDPRAVAEVYARWKMYVRAAETIAPLEPLKAIEWIGKVGDAPEAMTFARHEGERAQSEGKTGLAARWFERTGSFEAAARAYLEANEPTEALRLFEQLGDWRSAGACAEQAGEKERAAEFYNRAGDYEDVERVRRT